ncbi:MAG TPA: phosphotransferase [Anaerolineales bacterium]|nr:phosphotransferase [Anaerolineales bacterium]
MPKTDQSFSQEQDTLIWEGLQTFRDLPEWMMAARDPDRICAALSRAIPEFRSGQLILDQCDSSNIRYKDENWSGFYELTVRKPGESSTSTVNLQGTLFAPGVVSDRPILVEHALGSEDWHALIPELNLELWTKKPEGVLSALEMLTDPEQSRQYLMGRIRAGSPAYQDLQIEACHPRIARYKPGSRCTIVYHLDYAPGADADHRWPELVVAKTYRKEKGQNAYESMRAFWDSGLSSSSAVKIAEPLAYDAEMKVMIQGPIRQEKTLKELTVMAVKTGTTEAMAELTEAMHKTARGLAELHKSGTELDTLYGWEDDEEQVRESIEDLSISVPELAAAGMPFVEKLSSLEASSEPDPRVPSHGTFRPAQVLMHQGEIGFIDFDSCCKAEPAKDLGLFLCAFLRAGMATVNFDDIEVSSAPLEDAARLDRFHQLIAVSESFLEEYERSYMSVNRQRVALFEALELFILVLHAWTKIKVRELHDIMFVLEHFLPAYKILKLQ